MEALTLVDDILKVDHKKCLGCGLCVVTCSAEAIKLKNKEKETIPPKTTDNLNEMILNKKKELIEKYSRSKS
ncbi:MAG: 4Fe-4S binding protein [Candidatus Lokiarchaeota archaeon]|nr:4Fe-4S binding protein [Candidatus Lokiarchaeota archaeon]